MTVHAAFFFLAGLVFGALGVGLWFRGELRRRAARLEETAAEREKLAQDLARSREELGRRLEENARLDERLRAGERALEEQRTYVTQLLAQMDQKVTDTFRQLSQGVMGEQTQRFLGLAESTFRRELEQRELRLGEIFRPLHETLGRFDQKIEALEKTRAQEEATLREQLRTLAEVHLPRLEQQTEDLARVLAQPGSRGRWGELQLRRVVELAGLVEHVDFDLQVRYEGDGTPLRPDAVVHLPGGRSLVIDAKTPVDAYLRALDATKEDARAHLQQHARHLRKHIDELATRSYPGAVPGSPDFTVLFLPGEMMFRAAVEADPDLVDYGIGKRVLLTTPLTLVALLKAVAFGWQQDRTARNLAAVILQARDLRGRLAKFLEHWGRVGDALDRAVHAYNDAVGSYQRRVLVTLRRFEDLAGGEDGAEERLDPPEAIADRPLGSASLPLDGPGTETRTVPDGSREFGILAPKDVPEDEGERDV